MRVRVGGDAGESKHLRRHVVGMFAVAGLLICGFRADATAADCRSAVASFAPADMSVEVRKLQSKLMVAAISCEDSRLAYNDFVVHYRPALRQHGDALKAKFRSQYGGGFQSKLDSYVTLLANEASQQSNRDRAAFCADARATFARLSRGASPLDKVISGDVADRTAMNFHYQGRQVACAEERRR